MLYGVKRATSATYLSPIGLTRLRDSLSFMETAGSQRTLHRLNLVDQFSDPEKRFGVLTHPLLTSGRSYFATTSPIHRGIFLTRNIFGRTIRPPNDAFAPLSPDLHPDLTTRERVALQTSDQNCQVCHARINGIGFVLENYDAVGRFRATERDKPIDASAITWHPMIKRFASAMLKSCPII